MMEGDEEAGGETSGAGQSRDMGSLTGWQALANEVIAELGSGPQPGPSQDQTSNRASEDEEEEMQVSLNSLQAIQNMQPACTLHSAIGMSCSKLA